ncbi:MAG TPA: hypothetical protein VFH37_03410 [Candidatus Saccharimonadales bacterium]|nr:hypothetical protein [Candidatus Saccharimonadales bacterium]
MKKNITTLVLLSLVVGAVTTIGLSRIEFWNGSLNTQSYITGGSIANGDGDTGACFAKIEGKSTACLTLSRGYPVNYLHGSSVLIKGNTVNSWAPQTLVNTWISFRAIVVDWAIWSVVAAAALGILIWALEQAGVSAGFNKAKKKSRR